MSIQKRKIRQVSVGAADQIGGIAIELKAEEESGSGIEYTYDANGNMTSDGTKCYEYNEANQLKKVKWCSGEETIAEYVYDYNGMRMVKKNYSYGALMNTVYSWSDSFETRVIVGGGTESTSYYFINNELVAKKDNNGTRTYFHNDHLGSTTVITDASGSLAESTKYDPWGEVRSGGAASKFLYTGQERDSETGLHYYNARYYDPHIRRFTQPDIFVQDIYNPQSLNRYSYAFNNPLKYTDPSGHINILNYNNSLTQLQKNPSAQTYNNYLNTLNTFASIPGNTATPKTSASESIHASSTGNISNINKGYWPQYDTGGARDVFKPVYDFMLGNDIKNLKNPNSSLTQKGMAGIGIMGTFAPSLKGVKGINFADKLLDTSKVFNPDQSALIDLAKEAKRTNIGADESKMLVEWAKEVGLPFHDIMTHPNRKFGQFPHINIGPVKHIFIK